MADDPGMQAEDVIIDETHAERNLRLKKLELEIRDLERPHWHRNPAPVGAICATILALAGGYQLFSGNYFQMQQVKTDDTNAKAEITKAEAEIKAENASRRDAEAESELRQARGKSEEADRLEVQTNARLAELSRRVGDAEERLVASGARVEGLDLTSKAEELAATAEELIAAGQVTNGQKTAREAFRLKRTSATERAVIHAYSLPVSLFNMDEGATASYVAFSDDGSRLFAADYHTAFAWDSSSGRNLLRIQAVGPTFSTHGNRIAGFNDNRLLMFNALSGEVLDRSDTPRGSGIWTSAVSGDGRRLAVAMTTGLRTASQVWFRDTATGIQVPVKDVKGSVSSLVFSSDGTWVVGVNDSNELHVWDTTSGRELVQLETTNAGYLNMARLSPDSQLIAGSGRQTSIWNSLTGKLLLQLEGAQPTFSPDGQLISTVVANHGKTEVIIWKSGTGEQVEVLNGAISIRDPVFSRDGQYIATVGPTTDAITIWDRRSQTPVSHLRGSGTIGSMAFSADGARLVAGLEGAVAEYQILSQSNLGLLEKTDDFVASGSDSRH